MPSEFAHCKESIQSTTTETNKNIRLNGFQISFEFVWIFVRMFIDNIMSSVKNSSLKDSL